MAKKCPTCGKNSTIWEEVDKYPIFKKMETVLQSNKSSYEKKIALLDCLKEVKVDELEPSEERRVNCLLEGKLYGELAKQKMKDYKKLTVEDFNKDREKK